MRSQTLFKSTYNRLHTVFQQIQQIKDGPLMNAKRRIIYEKIQNAFSVANNIEYNVRDLQSQVVQNQLADVQHFLKNKNWVMFYDYEKKGFQLLNNEPISKELQNMRINIRSSAVQNLDHPHLRKTLYFHELKDMQKYFVLKYPKNSPNFVKDIFRSNVQNQLIDSQNPLGVPIKASPLQFMIQFNNQFIIEFYSRFGNINIRTIRLLQKNREQKDKKCNYFLYGMNIPRLTQKAVFSYTQNYLGLDEKQILTFHKLSHIGGRVEQIQFLINLFNIYATDLIQ